MEKGSKGPSAGSALVLSACDGNCGWKASTRGECQEQQASSCFLKLSVNQAEDGMPRRCNWTVPKTDRRGPGIGGKGASVRQAMECLFLLVDVGNGLLF